MKYMGSKARHAKEIIPFLMDYDVEGIGVHTPDMWYVEPFVGGANMIDKICPTRAPLRAGCDVHEYLISMWRAVSEGWTPPEIITEEDYKDIKNNPDKYPPELIGYVGFALSYAGKWWGGWRRDSAGKRNYVAEAYRNAMKQFPKLRGVKFFNKSVFDLSFKNPTTIYCDPPYRGTTNYKDSFDHDKFYDWACLQRSQGHRVFISEYDMPEDRFKVVWEKSVVSTLSNTESKKNKRETEKLFVVI